MIPFRSKSVTLSMLIDLLTSTCRSTQVKIASTDLWPQGMFTFSEMLALVKSESSFGAFVCHRRPGGSLATSDLVIGNWEFGLIRFCECFFQEMIYCLVRKAADRPDRYRAPATSRSDEDAALATTPQNPILPFNGSACAHGRKRTTMQKHSIRSCLSTYDLRCETKKGGEGVGVGGVGREQKTTQEKNISQILRCCSLETPIKQKEKATMTYQAAQNVSKYSFHHRS